MKCKYHIVCSVPVCPEDKTCQSEKLKDEPYCLLYYRNSGKPRKQKLKSLREVQFAKIVFSTCKPTPEEIVEAGKLRRCYMYKY